MKVQYYGVFTLTEIETDTEVPKMACIVLYGGVHTALRQQCHWVLSSLSVSVSVSGSEMAYFHQQRQRQIPVQRVSLIITLYYTELFPLV